jgi:hypothetical protein
VTVSSIGGGTLEKTADISQVNDKHYHIIKLYRVHIATNGNQTRSHKCSGDNERTDINCIALFR